MDWTLGDKIAAIADLAGIAQFLAFVVGIMIMIGSSRRDLRAYVFGTGFN